MQTGFQPLCVLTSARSGSNWLISLLDSHPEIVAHNELFNRLNIYSRYHSIESQAIYRRVMPLLMRNLRPVAFLNSILARSCKDSPQARYIAYKLFWYHNRKVLKYIIRDASHRIVVLLRRNKLAQYSSRQIALQTKNWMSLTPDGDAPRVDFDFHDFDRYAKKIVRSEAKIHMVLRRREYFVLYYEKMEANCSELFDWLGIHTPNEEAAAASMPQRQNKRNVLERFSSPDVVKEQLSGTRWESFLESDAAPASVQKRITENFA